MNRCRDHRDSTGWHGDAACRRRPECVVPVLTLGATRRFLLRPASRGRSTVLSPVAGDLVVMGGRCQLDWRHSVPKQAVPTGPRISVDHWASSQAVPDVTDPGRYRAFRAGPRSGPARTTEEWSPGSTLTLLHASRGARR